MGLKLAGILSGIGRGLESAGTIGMQYWANSRLQADRLKAETERQMALTAAEQKGAFERTKMTADTQRDVAKMGLDFEKEKFGVTSKQDAEKIRILGEELSRAIRQGDKELTIKAEQSLAALTAAKGSYAESMAKAKFYGDIKGDLTERGQNITSLTKQHEIVSRAIEKLDVQLGKAIDPNETKTLTIEKTRLTNHLKGVEDKLQSAISGGGLTEKKTPEQIDFEKRLANDQKRSSLYKVEKFFRANENRHIITGTTKDDEDDLRSTIADFAKQIGNYKDVEDIVSVLKKEFGGEQQGKIKGRLY